MGRFLALGVFTTTFVLAPVALASQLETGMRLPFNITALQETVVVVQPGDHLWKISRRHLDGTDTRLPTAPYWRRVVDLNRPTLRSGDPNLIYPGELIRLPPISDSP